MENKKIEWLQICRGGAALLVVFGHIVWRSAPEWYRIARDAIYLFHMPLFFAISGLVFGLRESRSQPAAIIKKKLLSLGLPYAVFAVVYLLMKMLLQTVVSVETQARPSDFITLLFFPSSATTIYWFIFTLLAYFMIFAYIKNKPVPVLLLSLLSIACFFAQRMGLVRFFGSFGNFAGYAFCFALAMLAGQNYEALKKRKKPILVAMVAFALFFCAFAAWYCATLKGAWLKANKPLAGAFALLLLAGGVSLAALISFGLQRINAARRSLLFVAGYSWQIYLLHPYFMNVTRNLLAKLWPTCPSPLFAAINFAAGTAFPLACALIAKRIPAIDFLFYPRKYIGGGELRA